MWVYIVWRSPRKFDRSVFTKLGSIVGKKCMWLMAAPKEALNERLIEIK